MVTRCYTFGYGHTDPITGQKLADKYAKITARTEEECRQYMFAIYGNQWAFDYSAEEVASWELLGPSYQVKLHIEVTLSD